MHSILLIALITGIGKSSLIQAILGTSPDIVHFDPPQTAMASVSPSSSISKSSVSRRSTIDTSFIPPTEAIVEIKASTKAYPPWYKVETERESQKTRSSLSRKESTNEVLERNIVFVDTPGYGSANDVLHFSFGMLIGSLMMCWLRSRDTLNRIMKRRST